MEGYTLIFGVIGIVTVVSTVIGYYYPQPALSILTKPVIAKNEGAVDSKILMPGQPLKAEPTEEEISIELSTIISELPEVSNKYFRLEVLHNGWVRIMNETSGDIHTEFLYRTTRGAKLELRGHLRDLHNRIVKETFIIK